MRPVDLKLPFGAAFIGVAISQGAVKALGEQPWLTSPAVFVTGALGMWFVLTWHLQRVPAVERLRRDLEKQSGNRTLLVVVSDKNRGDEHDAEAD